MDTDAKELKRVQPSAAFRRFAEPLGDVLQSYDPMAQLVLVPALTAVRGRSRSFLGWASRAGRHISTCESFYIASPQPDARAAGSDDHFRLAVSDSLAYALFDLFLLCLSVPNFATDVGDPLLEDAERIGRRERQAGYGFHRRSVEEVPLSPDQLSHPNCPQRRLAALHLTGAALDLIWTHELSHVVLGHVDYVRRHLGLAALGERPLDSTDAAPTMPLEVEADRFAIRAVVESASVHTPYMPAGMDGFGPPVRARLAVLSSAILTWFWAFQQRVDRTFDGIDPYASGSHPPPLARLHLATAIGRRTLADQRWPEAQQEALIERAKEDLRALADAKKWFSILNPDEAFGDRSRAFVEDINTVVMDWYAVTKSALEPFRYAAVQAT